MRKAPIPMILLSIAVIAVPASAWAQDQQVGQEGAVWNLGELAPRAYPSTVTAVNQSCPGAHDFHVSLEGETIDFLTIVGPTILTDIPPGAQKTSDVVINLRTIAPGPHNEGRIIVRCVDCPITCSQDYDVLAVHLTVLADASSAPADVATGAGAASPWAGIDLTTLEPAQPPLVYTEAGSATPLRWITAAALPSTTLVQEAVATGLVEISFAGTGRAAGEIFRLTITRRASTPFEMGFPLGTMIVPEDPRYSPMIMADDGAVALLEEITVVTIVGYTLDPRLAPPPAPGQINGAGPPAYSVGSPPTSGPFADAIGIINAGYTLGGSFSGVLPADVHLRAVTQRALWFDADPEGFGVDRLERDAVAQVQATGGAQTDEQVQQMTTSLWDDVTRAMNEGKR